MVSGGCLWLGRSDSFNFSRPCRKTHVVRWKLRLHDMPFIGAVAVVGLGVLVVYGYQLGVKGSLSIRKESGTRPQTWPPNARKKSLIEHRYHPMIIQWFIIIITCKTTILGIAHFRTSTWTKLGVDQPEMTKLQSKSLPPDWKNSRNDG